MGTVQAHGPRVKRNLHFYFWKITTPFFARKGAYGPSILAFTALTPCGYMAVGIHLVPECPPSPQHQGGGPFCGRWSAPGSIQRDGDIPDVCMESESCRESEAVWRVRSVWRVRAQGLEWGNTAQSWRPL